jgi:Family of unknown function (DUF6662)
VGSRIAVFAICLLIVSRTYADEQILGFVRGAETLPAQRSELYQFVTFHEGKSEGTYYAWDLETEYEYGFTDRFQASLAIGQNYFYNRGVDGDRDALGNKNDYRFQGVEGSAKYRILSTFKDPLGVALRLESGYLLHDEVDGLKQHDRYIKPEIDFQKDYLEDRLIYDLNFGAEWAWGKKPAEQYSKEWAVEGAAGVAYRFAPNWFAGAEIHSRWEYPQFDFYNFEHRVFYAGPSIHYSQQRWWVTLTWNYQVYGKGVDEPADGETFAEESRQLVRLKVGLNF